jgi:hypothetical protein
MMQSDGYWFHVCPEFFYDGAERTLTSATVRCADWLPL